MKHTASPTADLKNLELYHDLFVETKTQMEFTALKINK